VLWGCELIAGDGTKASGRGSRRPGVFFPVKGGERIWVAEGVATAISLHMETGDSVAACAGARQIAHAVQAIQGAFPGRRLVIMADDDPAGLSAAQSVGRLYGVRVCKPDFNGLDRGESDTDYNDLLRLKHDRLKRN
jgi:putative DNA primase/helicase